MQEFIFHMSNQIGEYAEQGQGRPDGQPEGGSAQIQEPLPL